MSEDGDRTVPVPVSVTLFNLLSPVDVVSSPPDASSSRNTTTSWFRPEYTSELLVPVRLEILLGTASASSNNETLASTKQERIIDDEAEEEALVLFTAPQDRGALHPSWDRLDERSDFWDDSQQERDPVYRSLRLRIVTMGRRKDNNSSTTVADVPLHPALLRRLPETTRDDVGDDVPWDHQSPPPKALPPNAVLIKFSDGSTRVDPPLYHLLLSEGIIVETNPKDESLLQDEVEENKRQERFTDDVFDKLNDTAASSPAAMKRKRSPSSLLETDDESQAVPVSPIKGDDDDDIRLYMEGYEDGTTTKSRKSSDDLENLGQPSLGSDHDDDDATRSDDLLAAEDLKEELEALEDMIEREQAYFDHDVELHNMREKDLVAIAEEDERIREEITAVQSETDKARSRRRQTEFLLEAQRLKLLRDLRSIYYIQARHDQRYFIRDQEIPSDLFGNTVPEDEISAAMGFLCHSIVMISKYLSVPLPYRIVCNSSRSAIQGDSAHIYPLFQARAVDRQHVEKGMELLERNISCILKSRNIPCPEKIHILGKVKRIYDGVIDGR